MDVDYLKTLVVAVLDGEENTGNSDVAYAALVAYIDERRPLPKSTLSDEDRDLVLRVLDTCDPASDCAIGNDEIARAREIVERA